MAYPFVQSYTDLGLRRGPVLGFVVHMAEGGGTVGYLSRANPNGVSVHYVIEYSGRIVQMLREDHMHSSLRSSAIRTSNDGNGFYGVAAARSVLGDWASIQRTLGPNHATIAVEIEGFAASGPNSAQSAALAALVAGVRARHAIRGNLGHRDFADYKSCPGTRIPWSTIGGHGAFGAPGGGTSVSLRMTNARAGEWNLVITGDAASAIVVHSLERIRLQKGWGKKGVSKVFVPSQSTIQYGGDAYVLADEDPSSPDPVAVLFDRDVSATPVVPAVPTTPGGLDEEQVRSSERERIATAVPDVIRDL